MTVGYFVFANQKKEHTMTNKKHTAIIKTIDRYEFKEKMETGAYQVIDVRTPREIAQGKIIKSALEINFYAKDFAKQINKLPKDEKYLMYCRSGNRSRKVLKLMKKNGFTEVYELKGGITAWQKGKMDR